MVRAWYLDGDALSNPRDEHQRLPPEFVALEDLYTLTGVDYYPLNVDTFEEDGSLDKMKEEKDCTDDGEFDTPGDSDLQELYREHLHQHELIRLVLEGCGYYDVRDSKDEWIRVEVVAGDLIVIPSGCYHRFMLDHTNLFRAKRLFPKDSQYSGPCMRPADDLDCRRVYLNKLKNLKVLS